MTTPRSPDGAPFSRAVRFPKGGAWRRGPKPSLSRGGLPLSCRRTPPHSDCEAVPRSSIELGREQREQDRERLSVEAEPVAAIALARNHPRTR